MAVQLAFAGDPASGFVPQIALGDTERSDRLMELNPPVRLAFLRGNDPYSTESRKYTSVTENAVGAICAGSVEAAGGLFLISDRFVRASASDIVLTREVTVERPGDNQGVRVDLLLSTLRDSGVLPYELEYFAGSAFYRHLDADGDGVPDTHSTYNVAWCEDKLTLPAVAAYDPQKGYCVALCRADLPRVDRTIMPNIDRGERFFVQDTEIGSLGFAPCRGEPRQMALRAHYPGFEGPQSFSIDRSGSPWGRFRAAAAGTRMTVSYLIRLEQAGSFTDAVWSLYKRLLAYYGTVPPRLGYTFETAHRARIRLVNTFYKEWTRKNGARGAAYILNFHPEEGKTLSEVVEYGFTGRTLTNAYANLRYGKDSGDETLCERARKIVDFYVSEVVQPNGFVYGVYTLADDQFVPWWSGITLPCAFSKNKEELAVHLSQEMADELWPLASEMRGSKGNFTRSISESAFGLLQCYETELAAGRAPARWLETAKRIASFFLKAQNPDGSWYRAVDVDGKPVRMPEHWFGRTEEMRKSGTYTIPVFLLKLYELTSERTYLRAASDGARFLRDTFGRHSYYYGSLLDAPHGNMLKGMGPIFDNTTPLVAMELHLKLYQLTSAIEHMDAAVEASKIACTWINIWNVPYPEGSTLGRYGFQSTGFSAVDIAVSSFQNDMMPLYWVRDWLKLAEITQDETYFTIARIVQFGENQMLSTEGESYGFAFPGVQNEGRHLSWFLAKEWTRPFGFGKRGKGEENKTYYGWVAAVPLAGYYRVVDEYGTIDFDAIYRKIFRK